MTLSQIDLIKKNNLSIQGKLGQHLLIDPNIQRKIVDCLDPKPDENVIEIGPGLGALTTELLCREACVWAIEKDPKFVKVLKEEHQSLLDKKFHLFSEDVLDFNFKEKIQVLQSKPCRLISNVPYYITAPILMHLIEHRDCLSEAVLMIQKEVADRLLASPGTKDYGRLTLALRYYADLELAFHVPPSCFTPKPEVKSSVIRLVFRNKESFDPSIDEAFLFEVIRVAFSQRRKTLLGLLLQSELTKKTRQELEILFEKMGLKPTARGEELLLKDFIRLSEDLKR